MREAGRRRRRQTRGWILKEGAEALQDALLGEDLTEAEGKLNDGLRKLAVRDVVTIGITRLAGDMPHDND